MFPGLEGNVKALWLSSFSFGIKDFSGKCVGALLWFQVMNELLFWVRSLSSLLLCVFVTFASYFAFLLLLFLFDFLISWLVTSPVL